jgi:hypothetical protein
MAGQIQQPVDFGNGHCLGTFTDFDNLLARLNLALFQDAKIEAWPAVRNQQSCHSRFAHPYADTIAGDARLRDFEERAANAVVVANANLRIRQTFNCEVLSKLSKGEVGAVELVLPIPIGIHLVNKYGPVLAPMACQISLAVAFEIQPTHHALALNRGFPNAGPDRLSAPTDLPWQTHID